METLIICAVTFCHIPGQFSSGVSKFLEFFFSELCLHCWNMQMVYKIFFKLWFKTCILRHSFPNFTLQLTYCKTYQNYIKTKNFFFWLCCVNFTLLFYLSKFMFLKVFLFSCFKLVTLLAGNTRRLHPFPFLYKLINYI